MLTTTYYVPTTSPSSSATTQLTLGKKKQDAQKKYSQEAAGAFRHQHHHHTLCLWSVATSFCQKATAGTKQSGSSAGCSYLKNSKGNGWISLRLFITSQPCRRNRELSSHSIFQIESTSVNRTEKGKNLQQRAWPCNLLHINRITIVPCSFTR